MVGHYNRYWIVESNTICQCTNYGIFMSCFAVNNTNRNNLILNNDKGIYASGSLVDYECHFYNNTIVSNTTCGMEGTYKAGSSIKDSIIYGNGTELTTTTPVTYSCVEGGCAGTGNIPDDPMFVANGDYHLSPSSPCVDTGDPTSDYSNEPLNGGGRVNIGRYGNTPEAALALGDGTVFVIR